MPSTTRRTWAAVSLVIALSAVIMTVPASASSADISGYQVKYATSDSNSNDKGAEVTCTGGTRVLGTGAEIIGVSGAVVIDEVIPTTYTVSAYGVETEEGTSASWSIRVRAVCGDPDESTTILSRVSPLNGMIPVSVTCDTGEFLLGTGYQLEGARGTASLDYVIPQLNMVYAHAVNRYPATYTDWTLRVFAICAEDRQRGCGSTPRPARAPRPTSRSRLPAAVPVTGRWSWGPDSPSATATARSPSTTSSRPAARSWSERPRWSR